MQFDSEQLSECTISIVWIINRPNTNNDIYANLQIIFSMNWGIVVQKFQCPTTNPEQDFQFTAQSYETVKTHKLLMFEKWN